MNRTLEWVAFLAGAVVFGVVLAAVAEFAFFVAPFAWLNLVFWAIIAIAIGFVLRTWAMAIAVCAVLGFTIVLGYSVMGFHGSAPLVNAFPAFAGLGVVGAIGMGAAGAIGHLLRRARNSPRVPHG